MLRVLAVVAPMFSRLGVGSDAVMPARPREHCVLLLRPWAATGRVTLGAPPLKPRQEPEVPAPPTSTQSHAAVPARPRFARTLRASLRGRGPLRAGVTLGAPPLEPWQEPEVPAPPTSTQSHAAVPARPRFARTLRVSLCGHGPLRAGVALGAPPLKPRQEPEVPAPPGVNSKPCSRVSSSARSARTLRVSLCGHGPLRVGLR